MTDASSAAALAERMRPSTIESFIGQEHLLAPGKLLHHMIKQAESYSIILWAPPGMGKTTIAHIIANAVQANFVSLSAVVCGIKGVR